MYLYSYLFELRLKLYCFMWIHPFFFDCFNLWFYPCFISNSVSVVLIFTVCVCVSAVKDFTTLVLINAVQMNFIVINTESICQIEASRSLCWVENSETRWFEKLVNGSCQGFLKVNTVTFFMFHMLPICHMPYGVTLPMIMLNTATRNAKQILT